MPNLDNMNFNAETPGAFMKETRKMWKRTKRVSGRDVKRNMNSSDQGPNTKRTNSSSDQAMGLGMKSKQIAKRGKRISKKVSIA